MLAVISKIIVKHKRILIHKEQIVFGIKKN